MPAAEKGNPDRSQVLYIRIEAVDGPGHRRCIDIGSTGSQIEMIIQGIPVVDIKVIQPPIEILTG